MSHTTSSPHALRRRDRLAVFGVVLLITLLGYAVLCVLQPQNVSDLESPEQQAMQPRNLKEVFRKSIEGAYAVTVSEDEINAYLARHLEVKQGGMLGSIAPMEKVLVRLEEDRAEIITIRKLAGRRLTTSMWIGIEQTESGNSELRTHIDMNGGPMPLLGGIKKGGRFGRLTVPQGFLLLTQQSHKNLAAVFSDEIRDGIEEMSRIRIRDGALELDPRLQQESETMGF